MLLKDLLLTLKSYHGVESFAVNGCSHLVMHVAVTFDVGTKQMLPPHPVDGERLVALKSTGDFCIHPWLKSINTDPGW